MKIYIEMFLDHNLGDDLFLDTILTRYSEHNFYLELPPEFELNPYFKKYKNLYINSKSKKKFLKIKFLRWMYTFFYIIINALKYDSYILVGGSLFEIRNKKDYQRKKFQYLKYKIYKFFKVKRILIGSNLGPFYNSESEELIKKILKIFDGITVRDLKSKKYLKKWEIESSKYSYGSDLIFTNKNFNEIKEDDTILGISIVNSYIDTEKQKKEYTEILIEIIKLYLGDSSENKVKLLGFDGGIIMSDEKLIEEVYKKLTLEEKQRVTKVIYSPKIKLDKYMEEFLECGQIIGGRFHSVILSLKFNKKVVAINYSDKIKNLLEDINAKEILIEYNELNKISPKSILKKLKNIVIEKEYFQSSENHFFYSDSILK